MNHELLIEIALDSETKRIAFEDVNTADGHYEGELEEAGDIVRELSIGGGASPAQTSQFSIRDADGKWKQLLQAETWKKRVVTFKLLSLETGTVTAILTAKIEGVSYEIETVTLEVRDDTLDTLDAIIPNRVFPDLFSDMPITTEVALIPIPIGTLSSQSFEKRGCCRAYLVDPSETVAGYRYVAAQVALKSITKVYNRGVEVDSGDWAVVYANITTDSGAQRMTFFDVDFDLRDENGDDFVTYDCTGLCVDNDETGLLITDIPEALQSLLVDLASSPLDDADFDSTLVTAAETAYSDESITLSNNGFVVTEWGDRWIDVIDVFAESFLLQFFQTAAGKYGMRFDDAQTGTAERHLIDSRDIVRSSFSIEKPKESYSTLEMSYAYDSAKGRFAARISYNDATEQTALGRDIIETSDLFAVRNVNTAQEIGQIKLFLQRSSRLIGSVTIPADPTLELGDFVSLTHFAGESSDAAGFSAKLFCIYSLNTVRDERTTLSELILVDHPGLTIGSPADSEQTRSSGDFPAAALAGGVSSDCIWTAEDLDSVSYSTHTLKVERVDGSITDYSITGADPGNMTVGSKYYFYLDAAVSITSYQRSTTYSDAIGLGKVLVAEAGEGSAIAWIRIKPGCGWIESGVGGGGSDVPNQVSHEEVSSPDLERLVNLTGDLVVADGKSITLNAGGDLIMTPHASNMSEVIFTGVGYLRATLATVSLYGTTGSAAKSVGVASYEDASNFSLLSLQDSSGFQALLTAEDGGNTSELAVVGGASGYASLEVQDTVEFEVRSGYIRSNGYLEIYDGVTAPGTPTSHAAIYVDTADGDLKVKFSDGHVATIATDS